MARFLGLWRLNELVWPKDPAEVSKMREKVWAGVDGLLKKGEFREFGYFLDGTSGYVIGEAESTVAFKNACMFVPYYKVEVYEIIPYEKGKEIIRELAQAAQR